VERHQIKRANSANAADIAGQRLHADGLAMVRGQPLIHVERDAVPAGLLHAERKHAEPGADIEQPQDAGPRAAPAVTAVAVDKPHATDVVGFLRRQCIDPLESTPDSIAIPVKRGDVLAGIKAALVGSERFNVMATIAAAMKLPPVTLVLRERKARFQRWRLGIGEVHGHGGPAAHRTRAERPHLAAGRMHPHLPAAPGCPRSAAIRSTDASSSSKVCNVWLSASM